MALTTGQPLSNISGPNSMTNLAEHRAQ